MSATSGQFWTQQFLKDDGTPYAGVRVFHYVAGNTTTNLDVYQNGNLTAPHSNPVVGDTSGRVSFYGSGTYRLLIKSSTADGNLTLYDWDPVELVHHTATVRAEDKAISLPSASSASRGRLFGVTDASGDLTSLWLQRTAAVWQQILTLPSLSQMIEFAKGTDIASTTNVTVPNDGNVFDITGTNTIETFSGFSGYPVMYTRTLSVLTFVHSASLILKGAQNRTTLANQVTGWVYYGGGVWIELFYTTRNMVDGALLLGNGLNDITELALPTSFRVLGHTGVAGSDPFWGTGLFYHGPSSVGAGSTRTHEGAGAISADQSLSGIHYYTNFTLSAGATLSLPARSQRLIIVASNSITIAGTINASGAGAGPSGVSGFSQAGGGGGGSSTAAGTTGGNALIHGAINALGGTGGNIGVSGSAPTQLTGSALSIADPFSIMGGASGGAGAGGGTGGVGGGSIVLIAPSVILTSTAIFSTAAGNGSVGPGGGGGGGAGNVYIVARSYTDGGATFTLTAGVGGGFNVGGGGNGAAGAAGVRQINIYG